MSEENKPSVYLRRVNRQLRLDKIRLEKEKNILQYQLQNYRDNKPDKTIEKRSRLFDW